jgi:hypothetical protein
VARRAPPARPATDSDRPAAGIRAATGRPRSRRRAPAARARPGSARARRRTERGLRIGEALEVGPRDPHQRGVALGDDRRGARSAGDQADLADAGAGQQVGATARAVARRGEHAEAPAGQHVPRVRGFTLAQQVRAARQQHFGGAVDQFGEQRRLTAGEQAGQRAPEHARAQRTSREFGESRVEGLEPITDLALQAVIERDDGTGLGRHGVRVRALARHGLDDAEPLVGGRVEQQSALRGRRADGRLRREFFGNPSAHDRAAR